MPKLYWIFGIVTLLASCSTTEPKPSVQNAPSCKLEYVYEWERIYDRMVYIPIAYCREPS